MKFHCTYCGHGIESASNSLGKLLTCPACGGETPVPQLKKSLQPEITSSPKSFPSEPGPIWGRQCRRIFLYSLLACFVVGAVTAILGLLLSEFGGIQARILLTTLSLGAFSLTGLCCAVLADQRRYIVFGGIGIAISIAGAVFAILTNWEIVTGWEILIRGRLFFLIVAVTFAHAALLLMINTANGLVRAARIATLAIIALVAGLLLAIMMFPQSIVYSSTVLGVLAVLDAFGTIATPILHSATRASKDG